MTTVVDLLDATIHARATRRCPLLEGRRVAVLGTASLSKGRLVKNQAGCMAMTATALKLGCTAGSNGYSRVFASVQGHTRYDILGTGPVTIQLPASAPSPQPGRGRSGSNMSERFVTKKHIVTHLRTTDAVFPVLVPQDGEATLLSSNTLLLL